MNKRRIVIALTACVLVGALFVAGCHSIRWNSSANDEPQPTTNDSQTSTTTTGQNSNKDDTLYIVFDDEERQKWLDRLDEQKTIVPSDADAQTQEQFIRAQDAWRKEYTDYVNNLYNDNLHSNEYRTYRRHSYRILQRWAWLEPHLPPTEQLLTEIEHEIASLREKLFYGKNMSEKYPQYNVPKLEKLISDLTALKERTLSAPLTFEQARDEYNRIVFKFEEDNAYHPITHHYYDKEIIIDRLGRIQPSDTVSNIYATLGTPYRYGEKSSLSGDYYKEVFYFVDDTTQAVISYKYDTLEDIINYQNNGTTVFLVNTITGERSRIEEYSQ